MIFSRQSEKENTKTATSYSLEGVIEGYDLISWRRISLMRMEIKMKNLFKIVVLSIISLASVGCDNETGFKTGGGIKKDQSGYGEGDNIGIDKEFGDLMGKAYCNHRTSDSGN